MKKHNIGQKPKAESSYAKHQRRRAEKIIQATGRYSAAFRNEVQQALDKLPHKLPVLFREAEIIDARLESAGRSVRAEYRKAGIPLGEPSKPLGRSPKHCIVREAEEIESLFQQNEADRLDEEMSERAQLISNILFDISNESGVDATHPKLVKAYVLATWDALPGLEYQHNSDRVHEALLHIQDLMNGCSQARFEEIDAAYNGWAHEERARHKEDAEVRREAEPFDSDELATVRKKLARLELVPENEAIAFQLKTEIDRLEREADTVQEWPDVIGGVQ